MITDKIVSVAQHISGTLNWNYFFLNKSKIDGRIRPLMTKQRLYDDKHDWWYTCPIISIIKNSMIYLSYTKLYTVIVLQIFFFQIMQFVKNNLGKIVWIILFISNSTHMIIMQINQALAFDIAIAKIFSYSWLLSPF